jgi:hypothetical protein
MICHLAITNATDTPDIGRCLQFAASTWQFSRGCEAWQKFSVLAAHRHPPCLPRPVVFPSHSFLVSGHIPPLYSVAKSIAHFLVIYHIINYVHSHRVESSCGPFRCIINLHCSSGGYLLFTSSLGRVVLRVVVVVRGW